MYSHDYKAKEPPNQDQPAALDDPTKLMDETKKVDANQTTPGTTDDSVHITDPTIFHILMYSLADRLMMEPLKNLSKSKVEKQLLHRFHPTIFPMAINAIYRSTPASDRGLRDMIITITTHNIRELRQIEPQIPFSEILSENLQFSSDLCLAFMDLYTPELGCTLWNRIRFTRTMIPNQPEEQPDFNGDV